MDSFAKEQGEKRAALIAKARQIIDNSGPSGMDENDQRAFDSAMAEADEIAKTLDKRNAARPGAMSRPDPEGETTWRSADGSPLRVLKPSQRMADLSPRSERDALDIGKYMRGIVTGRWDRADAEYRAASEGTLSAGGYMVPTPLSSFLIDRARNAAVCFKAGAQTVVMDAATLKIARVAQSGGDIGSAWMAENAAQTDTQATFEVVTLTSHTLSAYTKLSIELFEDAANIDNVVMSQIAKVLTLELDRAGLEGTGVSPQPAGILTQSGVNLDATTFGTNGAAISGTTPTGAVAWDWLSKAIYAVRQLNEYPTAVVYHERTAGELDLLRASTGVFLPPPPSVANLPVGPLTTNALSITRTQGSANTASNAYVGNFSELIFGLRNGLAFEVSREAADSSSSAFANRQVFIRVYGRFDVAVARPAAFRVVEGIL